MDVWCINLEGFAQSSGASDKRLLVTKQVRLPQRQVLGPRNNLIMRNVTMKELKKELKEINMSDLITALLYKERPPT